MKRQTYPTIDTREAQYEWLCHIETLYGVSLGFGQLYVDPRSGRVYAGSEYVAQIGPTASPDDAKLWADTIAHMPRGGHGIDVADRREGLTHNYEPLNGGDAA